MRGNTRGGHADDTGTGHQVVLLGRIFIGQQQGAGAVVHAGGIACSHCAVWAHYALELGQCFQRGRAGVLVLAEHNGVTLLLRDRHGHDFLG